MRNAQEAMPEGGRVRIVLRELPQSAVLSVEDEGTGIDVELTESVFDPFFTTKQTGTGLGLAVTRQIVQSHSGQIRCEPGSSGGARFVMEFPRVDSNSASSSSEA
jgi:signal transduction histidine kinase